MKQEYINYVRQSLTDLDDILFDLEKAMMNKDSGLIIYFCNKAIEQLNTIKEIYTDEGLF